MILKTRTVDPGKRFPSAIMQGVLTTRRAGRYFLHDHRRATHSSRRLRGQTTAAHTLATMRVVRLWRYPVKSMLGERLTEAAIDHRGVVGDRRYAVRTADDKLGSGKNSRRFRRIDGLFELSAHYRGTDEPPAVTHNGTELTTDDIRKFLGRTDIRLAIEDDIPHFDDAPLHMATTASIAAIADNVHTVAVDERRFRPNIVIDTDEKGFVENDWVGRTATVGPVRIEFTKLTERCVMTNNAQYELGRSPEVLKTATRLNHMCVGIYALVLQPGTVRLGDRFELSPAD